MVGEIVAGELYTSPRPAVRHAWAATTLIGTLNAATHGPRARWWILVEPELHLGDDVLVPDIAAWRRERLPNVPDVKFMTEPPDWVCEIQSPSNASFDRMKKMPVYQRTGIGHLWLVDPIHRTVESFAQEGGRWILAGNVAGAGKARLPPFDELEIEVGELWLPDAPESA